MKTTIEITRDLYKSIETKGKIAVLNDLGANVFRCVSLELPDKNNAAQLSCIPFGTYICKKVPATKKIPYEHISVTNVPNRSGICIHCGNFAAGQKVDIEGCILIGSAFKDINCDGISDVVYSKTTFRAMMNVLPDEFLLTIK